jgi:uncharacterized protein (DUF1778 family)
MARQRNTAGPEHVRQKRSPLNMKASPELRARIEEAAEETGLSLTQEVERRLLQSFAADDALGSRRTASVLRLIAALISNIEASSGMSWVDDYATWNAVRIAVQDVLKRARPVAPNQEAILAAKAKADAMVIAGEHIDRAAADTAWGKLLVAGGGAPPHTAEYVSAISSIVDLLAPAVQAQRRGEELAAAMHKAD